MSEEIERQNFTELSNFDLDKYIESIKKEFQHLQDDDLKAIRRLDIENTENEKNLSFQISNDALNKSRVQ